MDIISLLLLSIYAVAILIMLVYVSPIISAIIMIVLPVFFVVLLPDYAIEFFSIEQFSFLEGTVPVFNIHVLLFIWSALLGVIAYAEFLSWYLLRGSKPKKRKKKKISEIEEEDDGKPKKVNFKEFIDTIWKTLKGGKSD